MTDCLDRPRLIAALDETLGTATAERPVVVCLITAERILDINQRHGHDTGTALLDELADRLSASVRNGEIVGRVAGHQFAVVARPPVHFPGARLANRLVSCAAEPFHGDARSGGVLTTLHGAVTTVEHPMEADTVLAGLTAAASSSEPSRLSRVVTVEVGRRDTSGVGPTSVDLERAINGDQLVVHYQPCVELATGRLRGAEALVRWQHPLLGLLGPDQFIPLAESTQLVSALDAWVLESACRQLGDWARGQVPADFHLSVNISAMRLDDSRLLHATERAMTRHHVPPTALWLELTETAAMIDVEDSRSTMDALRSLGVRFMIDDFGTGYSSLAYLKQFPVDALKIDRMFTAGVDTDPSDAAIVQAILDVAAGLGLSTVVEGVETESQRRWLIDHGCDLAQGMLFSAPLTSDAMTALVKSGRPGRR